MTGVRIYKPDVPTPGGSVFTTAQIIEALTVFSAHQTPVYSDWSTTEGAVMIGKVTRFYLQDGWLCADLDIPAQTEAAIRARGDGFCPAIFDHIQTHGIAECAVRPKEDLLWSEYR